MALTNEQILQELKETMVDNTNTKRRVNEALTHAMTAIQNIDKRTAEAYDQGLQEAWKLAQKIVGSKEKGNYDSVDLLSIFNDSSTIRIFNNNTYDQANNKIKSYEKKKEEEEEEKNKLICGDEVVIGNGFYNGSIAIYLGMDDFHYWLLIMNPFEVNKCLDKKHILLTKTGRHVDLFKEEK